MIRAYDPVLDDGETDEMDDDSDIEEEEELEDEEDEWLSGIH